MRQPAPKYRSGQKVYDKDDVDVYGRPTLTPLYICCRQLNPMTGKWEYGIKDEDGNRLGDYPEAQLEILTD